MSEPATHPITIENRGPRLTVASPLHERDICTFLANELVADRHFTTGSCPAFRSRVLGIWGPGGARSTTPRTAAGAPADRQGYVPADGKLGQFPDSRAPED